MTWRHQVLESLYFLHLVYYINGSCSGQPWKKMDITSDHFKGSIATPEVSSIKECSDQCMRISKCGSFGVNVVNMTCFLYENLVWSGAQVISGGPPLYYYWKHQNTCPVNYTYDTASGVCYQFFSAERTWLQGKYECDAEGGHLIVADTPEKITLLLTIVTTENVDFVNVGASDYFYNKVWYWINGHEITEWAIGQPDHLNNENCLSYSRNFQGFVNLNCLKRISYICEIPVI